MRPLLVVALCLCAAAPPQAQRVILDLDEGYPEDQFYFLTYNAESDLDLKSRRDSRDGAGRSAGAAWRIETGAGGLGYAGFGYLHRVAVPANPFPDLSSDSHLSLWYNNVEPAPGAARVAFRFELHEGETETDVAGRAGTQVWVLERHDVLAAPTGWTELVLPLAAVADLGADGFAVLPGGFQGNGRLDLDQIRHWAVLFVVEGEPVGTVFEGTTLFDDLAAVARPVASGREPSAPLQTALLPGRPNPFSSSTTLAYALAEPADVSLRVYDVLGREVAVLAEGQRLGAGEYEAVLDGGGLAAGTYVCVLEVGGDRLTRVVTRGR